ncbi:coiled-coil domain-containing protein [Brevundimonas poindexterae]|uniref:tipN n=1 Tax=Brevundimonas poindexterae TaxID=74325 RepID=UPI001CFF4686|nr:tipN [Brevundimonas poindexterae]
MKSRHRPPLNLTAPQEDAATDAPEGTDAAIETKAEAEVTPEPEPAPESRAERRKRRQREEAEAKAAAAEAARDEEAAKTETSLSIPQSKGEAARTDTAPDDTKGDLAPIQAALQAVPVETVSASGAYWTAALAALLWAGGVGAWAAYEAGFGAAPIEPLRLAFYILVALAPAGLAFLLARAAHQSRLIAAETRRARGLSEALLAPTALAAHQTGAVLVGLKQDIDQAALAAERARQDMAELRQSLAEESRLLNEAAETASRTARRLVESLSGERDAMAGLGQTLEGQAAHVLEVVDRQSRMVVEASDLAQTQLREAETALAARAADMAAAAGEAQEAARAAADDLARQTLRLENAGAGVAEQIQSVEEGLGQQRAALVTAAYALRTDQEDFSAQVESQRAQLTEQLSLVRSSSTQLTESTTIGTEALRDLVEAAGDQFRALIEMSQREADNFDSATKVSLDRFEALSADARDALLEETRKALDILKATAEESRQAAADATEQAQLRADRLGEAVFEASQKAEAAAEARIDGARKVVTHTAELVDEAGERALQRLEATIERMNAAMQRVDDAISDLDQRAADLPEQARERVEAVRNAVEEGLAALSEASRKAADDTEALDAGFQERVKRNYEMLTEAVRLMGVVSGDSGRNRRAAPDAPPATDEAPALRRARTEPEGRGFGLRNRSEAGKDRATDDRIGWKDLMGDDRDETPMDLDTPVMPPEDTEVLNARMLDSIRRMGVDPNALLPRSRIEEAAEAFVARDPGGARQIVRRVAPAAVRSVSRRVLSDAGLKADAEAYVHSWSRIVRDHAANGDAAAVLNRLASDGGRAFLLLDAAVGDLS